MLRFDALIFQPSSRELSKNEVADHRGCVEGSEGALAGVWLDFCARIAGVGMVIGPIV